MKKQNSSPKPGNLSKDEFKEFIPKQVLNSEDMDFKSDERMPETFEFQLPEGYWDSVMSDPKMAKDMERLLERRSEKRVLEIIEKESASIKEKILKEAEEKGYQQGHEKGFTEGKEASEKVCKRLDELCSELVAKHDEIVTGHEEIWCNTLLHILNRFMVPNGEEFAMRIKNWLREGQEEMSKSAKVKIYLPPEDYGEVNKMVGEDSGDEKKYAWKKDLGLKKGEVRFESEMGGVIFSPFEEVKGLQDIIDHCFGENKN